MCIVVPWNFMRWILNGYHLAVGTLRGNCLHGWVVYLELIASRHSLRWRLKTLWISRKNLTRGLLLLHGIVKRFSLARALVPRFFDAAFSVLVPLRGRFVNKICKFLLSLPIFSFIAGNCAVIRLDHHCSVAWLVDGVISFLIAAIIFIPGPQLHAHNLGLDYRHLRLLLPLRVFFILVVAEVFSEPGWIPIPRESLHLFSFLLFLGDVHENLPWFLYYN